MVGYHAAPVRGAWSEETEYFVAICFDYDILTTPLVV
jgi:hypothetical protein